MDLSFHPLTADRWADFEQLFGPRGACAGCWCMFFRQSRTEFNLFKGDANRQAMKEIVESGEVPGLLAYAGEQPVGWCAVSPRETFTALKRSRTIKPVDDQPAWAVVCFFVEKRHRRQGVTVGLLEAAARWVKEQGGTLLEGYPLEPGKDVPDVWAFEGIQGAFLKAGFTEVARPGGGKRTIMRRFLKDAPL